MHRSHSRKFAPSDHQGTFGRRLLLDGTWLFVVGMGLGDLAARAAEPGNPSELVQQLGSATLRERDLAARRLVESGEAAMPALEAGLKHSDAEVRARCRQILSAVRSEAHQRQLALFIADAEQKVTLPGWSQFRQMVGDDTAARGLFVDIQRAEPELVREAESQPKAASQQLDRRCRELYQEQYRASFGVRSQVSADSVAALMFVSASDQVEPNETSLSALQSFAFQQVFRHAVLSGPRKDALKELLGQWLERTAERADGGMHMRLALSYGVPQGLSIAKRLLKAKDVPADQLPYALLAVGRLGTAEDAAVVEARLDDARPFQAVAVRGKAVATQVRDVALAVLIHLNGENLADYGLETVLKNSESLFTLSTIGFASDQSREQAFERWKARQSSAN